MILVIDNYDSFVHNLARYLRQLGAKTVVRRNDQIDVDAIRNLNPSAIVISPGPCTPDSAGCSLETVQQLGASTPILGVCLGHQAIVQAYGGAIIRAEQPMHGRTSEITHDRRGIFADVPSPMTVGRYHSLVGSNLPDCLQVTATTEDQTIMAVQHESHPVYGVQFHPESILTQNGYLILQNFLKLAKLDLPFDTPLPAHEFQNSSNSNSC